jgi:hypothetical protein
VEARLHGRRCVAAADNLSATTGCVIKPLIASSVRRKWMLFCACEGNQCPHQPRTHLHIQEEERTGSLRQLSWTTLDWRVEATHSPRKGHELLLQRRTTHPRSPLAPARCFIDQLIAAIAAIKSLREQSV